MGYRGGIISDKQMDKMKYLLIAACRSAQAYADGVYDILKQDEHARQMLLELRIENIDFADSKVRPKIVQVHRERDGTEKELSDALLNSHLLVFQHIQNPFAKDPEKYAAEALIEFMGKGKRSLDTLNSFLMDLACMEQHRSGEWRGFVKSYFMEKKKKRLKEPYLRRLMGLFNERACCPEHIFRAALQTYIRGVIQPRYPSTELVEFFGTVFNAKRRGAPVITAVWPFSDGRSDRFARGENNETEDLADTASRKGIEHLITVRMHSKDKQGETWRRYGINVHDIDTTEDLAERTVVRYADLIRAKLLDVTTIDIGGKPGIREYIVKLRKIAYERGLISSPIDIPWTIMDKDRLEAHVVGKVVIKEGYGKDNPKKLEGKTLLVYDDMIDTSGSLMTYVGDVAEAYHVKELIVVVEHPVFSYPASRNLTQLHRRGLLREVVTYDTIPQPKYPWHVVLDSKPLVAAELKKLFVPSNNLEMPQNPDW